MPVTLRMAFRNLVEHKAKSLIVGSLLAIGVLILVLGNAFLDASRRGIETSFTANYTADVIITGTADGPVSLFGVQSIGGLEQTPIIPDYEKVYGYASTLPGVVAASGMASGFGLVTNEEQDEAAAADGGGDEDMGDAFIMLFGVDAEHYWKLFEGLTLVQGHFLAPGEQGLMVGDGRLEKISKRLGRAVGVGDEVLIQGMGATGIRLRSVRIVGTFSRAAEGAGPEQLSYIDINTLRSLNGMTLGATEDIVLTKAETGLLKMDDLDSLFGDDMFEEPAAAPAAASGGIAELLGDTSARDRLNQADTGAWHAILMRLDHPSQAPAVVARLNAWFAAEGIDAKAGDWQVAAGPYAQSVDVLRIVFTVAVIILAIVAVIIIMNTMVVSVIERTGEIGTMRALGAGKLFVRKMFAAETTVLSLVFGVIGIALSFVAAGIVNAIGIEASNQFFEILFGGKVLSAVISPGSVVGALALIVAVGLAAHVYPVAVALRIQPVRAMQSE